MYEARSDCVTKTSTPTTEPTHPTPANKRARPTFAQRSQSDISFLWDKATAFATVTCMLWLLANTDMYFQVKLLAPFALLFIPALVGNLASIPFCWRALPQDKQAQSLVWPSVIVGTVGWLVVVPAASWLVAPLLSTTPQFRIGREVCVFAFYIFAGEFLFYCAHRALHANTSLFRLVHSQHHRITDPHVVNASYQHPIELIVITMGTAWVGPLLISGHWTTVAVWHATIMVLGNIGHCGDPTIHDKHHRTANDNYGFLFMDAMMNALTLAGKKRSNSRTNQHRADSRQRAGDNKHHS